MRDAPRNDVPRVKVRDVDLHGEAPAAMYDSRRRITLGLDFNAPPDEVAEAVEDLLQEAFDSGRWHRRDTAHGKCEDGPSGGESAPQHPSDGIDC